MSSFQSEHQSVSFSWGSMIFLPCGGFFTLLRAGKGRFCILVRFRSFLGGSRGLDFSFRDSRRPSSCDSLGSHNLGWSVIPSGPSMALGPVIFFGRYLSGHVRPRWYCFRDFGMSPFYLFVAVDVDFPVILGPAVLALVVTNFGVKSLTIPGTFGVTISASSVKKYVSANTSMTILGPKNSVVMVNFGP